MERADLEGCDSWQAGRIGHKAVIQEDVCILDHPQRNLVLNLGCPQPTRTLAHDEGVHLQFTTAENVCKPQDISTTGPTTVLNLFCRDSRNCKFVSVYIFWNRQVWLHARTKGQLKARILRRTSASLQWASGHLLRLAAPCPDHDNISKGGVANPALPPIQHPAAIHLHMHCMQ